jgi:hypothetical protein
MAGPKPKRADIIKDICEIARIKYDHPTQFSNEQLRELLLWVRQARKIIADISGGANAST